MLRLVWLVSVVAVYLTNTTVIAAGSEEALVETALGRIRGRTLTSRLGTSFLAFRGIRYAEPPLGELRFKNPRTVKAWKPTVFNATEDGPMCPQETHNLTDISEDCLRLNIYTKDLRGSRSVVVYLHPGGFYSGSGQSKNFAGPQSLMDRDVVFVTLNYRLGTLGFLATGTEDAPGNAGLKDQVMALRWIQKYIHNFGGNPDSVTLLGYSAGSLSIGLHMCSPMSRGLFHRGIMMSASPLGQWQYEHNGNDLARKQGRLLNCPLTPEKALMNCLMQKPVIDFVNTTAAMFEFNWNPILNWLPVIEDDFGQERFLVEDPYKTIQSGDFYMVPLLIGITEFEFVSAAFYTLRNDTQRHLLNENFAKYAPIYFLYERDTANSRKISALLREEYLGNEPLQFPDSLRAFGELYSDAIIGFEYHRFLQLVSPFVPLYTYLFTYRGRYSHFEYPEKEPYGAVHHDELLYLLHVPVLTPLFKETDPEHDTIERLTRMWTEFAKKDDPNNPEDEYLRRLNWTRYSDSKKEYLDIGTELKLKTGGIYMERFQLWDSLFPVPTYS